MGDVIVPGYRLSRPRNRPPTDAEVKNQ